MGQADNFRQESVQTTYLTLPTENKITLNVMFISKALLFMILHLKS